MINPEKRKIKLFFFDLVIFDVMTILRDSRARIPFQSQERMKLTKAVWLFKITKKIPL